MSYFKFNGRYKYAQHPHQPIGKVTGYDIMTDYVTMEWEDTGMIPPTTLFPSHSFIDGTLIELSDEPIYHLSEGSSDKCWMHNWVKYVGLRETYEYCKNCDAKREIK